MIQITLQFTSIETAISVLRGIPENAFVAAPVVEKFEDKAPTGNALKAEKPAKVVKSEPAAPAADTAAAEPKADVPAPDEPADEAPLDYAVLQKAVFALAGKSRDAALALNTQFGVKNMRELPEGKRHAALAAAQAKLAELEVA